MKKAPNDIHSPPIHNFASCNPFLTLLPTVLHDSIIVNVTMIFMMLPSCAERMASASKGLTLGLLFRVY